MGCWAAPFTTGQAKKLRTLLKTPIHSDDATDKLYHLVGDDDLFDTIDDLAKRDKAVDIRPVVLDFLQTWFGKNGDDAEVLRSVGFVRGFEKDALEIFKDMLTAWNERGEYPA